MLVWNILILINLFFDMSTVPPSSESYMVTKVTEAPVVDADWDKKVWQDVTAIELTYHMGDKPEHFPKVLAKMAYDDKAIYVIFKVHDQYVRATRTKNQDAVYKDSCVEFFFSPSANSDQGYFNLEMNCGGTMLLHHQLARGKNSRDVTKDDIDEIQVAHSMPKEVFPEIKEPVEWTVEYRIPFEILENYHEVDIPTPGTVWKGNFYKCADDSSHPHWLTWSLIDLPRPDFHQPSYFGTLVFGE